MMTDFSLGVLTGAAMLLVGFTIGWNAAFFVMWRHEKQRQFLTENDDGNLKTMEK